MALGVLCILVRENSWISKSDKTRFYLTYGIIALSALTEWIGIQLNGNEQFPSWMLATVKCADYILTPMAGGAMVAQMKLKTRLSKALMLVLVFNAAFQIVSVFFQWTTAIDSHNHYTHGPLYIVYVIIYLLIIALVAAEFLVFGLSHRRQNRASLFSVLFVVIAGIAFQEILGGEFRTAYIAITMGAALMFIHYSEFYKMNADEQIKSQRKQLMKDALSGLRSRHAYMKALEKYRDLSALPGYTTVIVADINGLKEINDTAGHDVGDELIVGAAHCVKRAVGNSGLCYRTGGDEFVVLAQMNREKADSSLLRIAAEVEKWSHSKDITLSLSTGYAIAADYEDITIDELVRKADQAMYAEKAEYYKRNGRDRRLFV